MKCDVTCPNLGKFNFQAKSLETKSLSDCQVNHFQDVCVCEVHLKYSKPKNFWHIIFVVCWWDYFFCRVCPPVQVFSSEQIWVWSFDCPVIIRWNFKDFQELPLVVPMSTAPTHWHWGKHISRYCDSFFPDAIWLRWQLLLGQTSACNINHARPISL